MNQPERILLGHLASFGDCLYATAVARQIKQDFPGCHLTWAVGSLYRSAIEENPYVDEVWEISLTDRSQIVPMWRTFVRMARERIRKGDFTKAFFTQVAPDNYQNFDGTVRSSVFRGYPGPITVPVNPVMHLRPEEIDTVRRFADAYTLGRWRHVVLFECASASGQSFVTPGYAFDAARIVVENVADSTVILSSNTRIATSHERIIDGSILSIRENAELSKYCTLLVGCSSGISWICTSDWAKPLPTIQVLRGVTSVFASMVCDAEYFRLPTSHIIEMTDSSREHLAACIISTLREPFSDVRAKFHQRIPVKLNFYFSTFFISILKQRQPVKAFRSVVHVWHRFGWHPFLEYFSDQFRSHGIARFRNP
jgi:hypothetical protein